MASQTITGNHASFSITVDSYTLTNLGTVGSNTVATGLTVSGTADTVVNAGTLSGESYAVAASQGLSLTNQTGGRISGDTAIDIYGAPGSVTNAGVITGVFQGVALGAGGYVNNQSGGAITGTGVYGIQIRGGAGTVTNAGSISGGTDAVRLAAGYANRLVVDPGARFTGTVSAGNTTAPWRSARWNLPAAPNRKTERPRHAIHQLRQRHDRQRCHVGGQRLGRRQRHADQQRHACRFARPGCWRDLDQRLRRRDRRSWSRIRGDGGGGRTGHGGETQAESPARRHFDLGAGGRRHQPERWHDRRDLRTGHRSGRFRHRGQRWQHFRPLRRRPV